MLTEIISDEKVLYDLQKITYGKNNELGPKTLDVFMKLVAEKRGENPLTQLALVGCKSRLSTISPLLTMLNTVENQLQTLLIPKLNLGEDGFAAICEMVRKNGSLRNLDISWNNTLSSQTSLLFKSLAKNR